MTEKITERHRKLTAYIYIRQSTVHQVRHNHQGRQRQYDLAAQAKEFGFSDVIIIDEDQGKTGSGMVERPGFQTLLSAVCGGKAGAVFALEASRLARNNRDWHHLVDLCSMTETLIVDYDGIYDPRQLNDRLLLGLKGTMSEFELGLFRQRARKAFEMKVASGHAMWEMPVGMVRDENDCICKIADRQVQTAISCVFKKFRELGSARQATLWYRDEKVTLPEVVPGTRGQEVVWRLPGNHRLLQILKNPIYAGALAYGRTASKTCVKDNRIRKSSSRSRKPREQWKVLILDNHTAYIKWDEYLDNQNILESNASQREGVGTGAPRAGSALLAGLMRCGHCGRKLSVGYSGKGGRVPRYCCNGGRENRGSAACQSLGGFRVEGAVTQEVLDALKPAGIQAGLDALKLGESQHDQKRKMKELALEKARYQLGLARRQYDCVDPANRLVAAELESRWNLALEQVAELEQELNAQAQCIALTEEQREGLQRLAEDLPALWNHPQAPAQMKKRILRSVLEEIVISDDGDKRYHLMVLHWKGGVHSELQVPRNTTGKKANDTDKTALELIKELSKVCNDQAIAATLNRLGYRTGSSRTWRKHSVSNARTYYKLENYHKNGDWLTIERTAQDLQVSHTVIRRLIREKILPATQVVCTAPWVISSSSLSLPEVQKSIIAVKQGRQLRHGNPNQQEFPLK